jgi:hypothetical protein
MALKRSIHDMDEESAKYLANTGLPMDQLAEMWRKDKTYVKEEAHKQVTNQRRWRKIVTDTGRSVRQAQQVFKDVGIWTTGPIGVLLAKLPGTPAADVEKAVETLMANIAFTTMEQLKMASEQGATGLGQVQIREFEALQNSIGNLKQAQSPAAMRRGLAEVMMFYERQKVIARDPAKFDAMTDDEYYGWLEQFEAETMADIEALGEEDPDEGWSIVE